MWASPTCSQIVFRLSFLSSISITLPFLYDKEYPDSGISEMVLKGYCRGINQLFVFSLSEATKICTLIVVTANAESRVPFHQKLMMSPAASTKMNAILPDMQAGAMFHRLKYF